MLAALGLFEIRRDRAQPLRELDVRGLEEHRQIVRRELHHLFSGAPAKRGGRDSLNAACASAKSGCCMHSACACASASIAVARGMVCSLSIICLVIACANAGPLASLSAHSRAVLNASSPSATTRLTRP